MDKEEVRYLRGVISGMSDSLFGYLLLRRLWQIQDASGVSHGRHLRNALLEAVLELIRPEVKGVPLWDGWGPKEFDLMMEGAKFRTFCPNQKQQLLPLRPIHFPDRSLSMIVLELLHEWYVDDRESSEFPLRHEMEIVEVALRILQTEDTGRVIRCDVEPRSILGEVSSRVRRRSQRERELADLSRSP